MAESPDALGPITADRYFNAASESSILEYELDNALLRIAGIDPEKPEKWPCGNIVYDSYDSSFEFWGCEDDFALTEQQWAQCRALGFSRAWLCYKEGTERYYPGGSIKTSPDGVGRSERGQVKQIKAENARLLTALRTAQQERDEQVKRLAHCCRLTGADPDGNTDAALAVHAELEVKCLRHDLDVAGEDHDKLKAQLTAALSAKDEAERQLKALREAAREVIDAPGIISTDERIDEMKALLLSDPTPTQETTT